MVGEEQEREEEGGEQLHVHVRRKKGGNFDQVGGRLLRSDFSAASFFACSPASRRPRLSFLPRALPSSFFSPSFRRPSLTCFTLLDDGSTLERPRFRLSLSRHPLHVEAMHFIVRTNLPLVLQSISADLLLPSLEKQPPLLRLDTYASRSSTTSKEQGPTSPYLFGSPLTRVRTRTSSISSSANLSPSADVLASPSSSSSPYFLGAPLSRVETRNDSFDSLSPPKTLYEDRFIRLTSTHLTLNHLLLRPFVTFPISRIHSAKSLVSPAQRVVMEGRGKPSADLAYGLANGGVGWTAIAWARDAKRTAGGGKGAVVVDVEGWLLRVGFSVEDEEAFWEAWSTIRLWV